MCTPQIGTGVDVAVLTACSFAYQALAVMADHAKDGRQARVRLRPRRQGWIQKQTLPRSYSPSHNVLERSYSFGNSGMGLRIRDRSSG